MRKVFLFVLLFVFVGVFCFAQLPLNDVPANHWGYESVKYLLEAGIISGMPDGTFQGNTYATRYQLATSLYRTIEYLKSSLPYLKAEDITSVLNQIQNLKTLVDGVARNYENLGSKIQSLEAKIESSTGSSAEVNSLKTLIASNDSRLLTLERGYDDLRSTNSSIQGNVSALSSKITNLENQIRTYDSSIALVKSDVNRLNSSISDNTTRIKSIETLVGSVNVLEMKSNVTKLSDDLMRLKSDVSTVNSKFDSYDTQINKLNSLLSTTAQDVSSLKLQASNTGAKIDEFGTKVSNISADYEGFKSDILPRVSKNGSDILNNTRQIQDLQIQLDLSYQDFNNKLALPTWLGVGGIVVGIAGIGVGVYSYLYAQNLYEQYLKPTE